MNRDCSWLTDEQFARIAPHLPNDTRGKPRVDDRRVISGIVHVLKSGARWVDAPSVYGPRKTLYNRFVRQRWSDLNRVRTPPLRSPAGACATCRRLAAGLLSRPPVISWMRTAGRGSSRFRPGVLCPDQLGRERRVARPVSCARTRGRSSSASPDRQFGREGASLGVWR